MTRMISALLIIMLISVQAHAADVECSKDWPTRCSAPLETGDKAPFAGQLVTPDLAIHLGLSTEHCDRRIAIEVSRTSSIAKADKERDAKVAAADLRAAQAETEMWKKAAEDAEPKFYERPLFVAASTVVGMVLVYFGAVGTVRLAERL